MQKKINRTTFNIAITIVIPYFTSHINQESVILFDSSGLTLTIICKYTIYLTVITYLVFYKIVPSLRLREY